MTESSSRCLSYSSAQRVPQLQLQLQRVSVSPSICLCFRLNHKQIEIIKKKEKNEDGFRSDWWPDDLRKHLKPHLDFISRTSRTREDRSVAPRCRRDGAKTRLVLDTKRSRGRSSARREYERLWRTNPLGRIVCLTVKMKPEAEILPRSRRLG